MYDSSFPTRNIFSRRQVLFWKYFPFKTAKFVSKSRPADQIVFSSKLLDDENFRHFYKNNNLGSKKLDNFAILLESSIEYSLWKEYFADC